jgi:hypothetical protein
MTIPLYPCPLFTFVLSNTQPHSPLHALPLIHLTTEVLVLRLAPAKKKKKKKGVQWAEDVVDNEFMNKKSSKSKFVHLSTSFQLISTRLFLLLSLFLVSNPLFPKPMQNVVYFINKRHLETGVMVRIVMQNVMNVAKVIMLVTQNHRNNHDEQ